MRDRAGQRFDGLGVTVTLFTTIALASIVGMFLFLMRGSIPALRHEGVGFFIGNRWAYRKEVFQAAALFYGTAAVSLIALILSVPFAFATALFTSEICSRHLRRALKFVVELLAAVPSVICGLLGVLFLRQWMAGLFRRLDLDSYSGDTLLTAGVLLAIMLLPTLTTLFDDAFRSVPSRHRDAARGLGLTRAETALFIVVPQAASGVLGALLLALGRALGETIAVFLVVGRADNRLPKPGGIARTLIDAGQTITSKLGGSETNIAVGNPLHTSALLALALMLFVVVCSVTIVADVLRGRLKARART